MALRPHSEPEFTVVSLSPRDDLNLMALRRYSGAFFPGAARFTIGGGDFTSNVINNVYNPPPEQPAGTFSLWPVPAGNLRGVPISLPDDSPRGHQHIERDSH
jgi:hypothetical protein